MTLTVMMWKLMIKTWFLTLRWKNQHTPNSGVYAPEETDDEKVCTISPAIDGGILPSVVKMLDC